MPRKNTQRVPAAMAAELRRVHREDRDGLRAALRDARAAGWKLQPLGDALGLTRQRVEQIAARAGNAPSPIRIQPPPPPKPPRAAPRPARPMLTDDECATIIALTDLASRLRGGHGTDDPRRKASEELTRLLDNIHGRGVTMAEISRRTGIKQVTIYARLGRHGRQPAARRRRGDHRGARLTAGDVVAARLAARDGVRLSTLARQHGVHHETLAKAVYGQTWATLADPPPLTRPSAPRRARLVGRLTAENVVAARREWVGGGTTKRQLAARHRVGVDTIREAIHGITWAHITDPPPVPRGADQGRSS